MTKEEKYINNLTHFINKEEHHRFPQDWEFFDSIDEIEEKYPKYYEEYKTCGLLNPDCYATDDEVSLVSHNRLRDKKNVPVYYAVIECDIEKLKNSSVVVERGLSYKSEHYAANMYSKVYTGKEIMYWRMIPDNEETKKWQCCFRQDMSFSYFGGPKLVVDRTESEYVVPDYDYSKIHCTTFYADRFYRGAFLQNRLVVIATEKKLVDEYIEYHTNVMKNKISRTIDKLKETMFSL